MKSVSHFLLKSESHFNRLYQDDHTLPHATEDDPESWDTLFFSILARGDVELRGNVNVTAELEMFIWAYMHYTVYYFGCK